MTVRVVVHERAVRELVAGPEVRDQLVAAAYPILSRARAGAPVDTGRLRRSGRIRVGSDQHGLYTDVVFDARGANGYPYARLANKRRPYLRPAIRG